MNYKDYSSALLIMENLKKWISLKEIPKNIFVIPIIYKFYKPVSTAKLNDIKSILHLIPTDAKSFYKKLTGSDTVTDDIDGFNGSLDFEPELQEDY